MSQADIAAKLGIHHTTINKYELGRIERIPQDLVPRWLEALGARATTTIVASGEAETPPLREDQAALLRRLRLCAHRLGHDQVKALQALLDVYDPQTQGSGGTHHPAPVSTKYRGGHYPPDDV